MTPEADTLSCGIQVVEIVGKKAAEASQFLFDKYRIDCRPMNSNGLNVLRISLSLCNTKNDTDILVKAMKEFAG